MTGKSNCQSAIVLNNRQSWLLPSALMFWCFAAAAQPPDTASAENKPAPLPIEQMRAVVYTKEFAKRFALPDPEPGNEPGGGIQAMEFAVENNPNAPYYYCMLYLYLDGKLPIAYPEEAVRGTSSIPSRHTQLMSIGRERWLSMSLEDRKHFGERQGRYNLMAWFATPDFLWRKQGYASGSMSYEEYHRDLFPDLAYLKIDTTCQAYSRMDNVEVIQLWLRHERSPDNQKLRIEADDFVRFPVPHAFYGKVIGWSKQAHAYNAKVIETENIRRRVQQQSPFDGTSKRLSGGASN